MQPLSTVRHRVSRLLTTIALLLALPGLAPAADLLVPTQYPSIQAAIDASGDGDRILVSSGTYSTQLAIPSHSLEIAAAAQPVVIDGGGIGDTISGFLSPGDTLTLTGLTITGSFDQEVIETGGAGIYVSGGRLHLRDCIVIGNDTGVLVIGGSDHLVENCRFEDHWRHGLRFLAAAGPVTVRYSIFTANHAFSGGAGLSVNGPVAVFTAQVVIEGCEFDMNDAFSYGAGVYFEFVGTAHVLRSLFTNNESSFGGALVVGPTSEFLAQECRFFGNHAGQGGGALVDNAGGAVTFDRCLFVDNTVDDTGGAIGASINHGSIHLDRCTIANNAVPGASAIWANGHDFLIENSIIWGNGPGALFETVTGTIELRYTDVQGGFAGPGNLDVDPLFTDPANGYQYSLQAGSPCIDAGDPGHPLDPDGTVVDLGAIPFLPPSGGSPISGMGPLFVRGDGNQDASIDVADAVTVLDRLFSGGPIECEDAADANDDGDLGIADAVRVLGFLFASGEPPAAPFPSCWWDASVDALGCEIPSPCP